MKVIHIICKTDEKTKRPIGVTPIDIKSNLYMSCCWDFDLEEMKQLIGGMIFFHKSKSERSYLGGKIYNVHPIEMTPNYEGPYYTPTIEDVGKRSDRMMFEFEITTDGRDVKWRGLDYGMSYCGGVVDTDKTD